VNGGWRKCSKSVYLFFQLKNSACHRMTTKQLLMKSNGVVDLISKMETGRTSVRKFNILRDYFSERGLRGNCIHSVMYMDKSTDLSILRNIAK
jgi:hypothetical protein